MKNAVMFEETVDSF